MSGAPESSIWRAKYCENQLFTYAGILVICGDFYLVFDGFGNKFDDFWLLGRRFETP